MGKIYKCKEVNDSKYTYVVSDDNGAYSYGDTLNKYVDI